MKKILAVFLTLLILFSFASCSSDYAIAEQGDENGQQGDANGQQSETDVAETQETVVPKTLSLGGADISEFTVVYSKNILAHVYSRYDDLVTQDTEYDAQSAAYFAERVKTQFGATVKTAQTNAEGKTVSIITNQNLSQPNTTKFKTDKSYAISMKSGNLEIYGATYSATYRAIDAFFEYVLSMNTENAELAADFVLEGEANILVVACIGDSLTNGSKPSDYQSSVDDGIRRDIVSYPAVMQRMLWKDAVVYNYGQGGRTMTENFVWEGDGNHAYNASAQYPLLMENAKNIDLALIMLGTNDANANRLQQAGKYIYSSQFQKDFTKSCENIVNALKEKNANVKALLLNAPVAYNSNIEDNLRDFIRGYQANTAKSLGLGLIDVYGYTNANMTEDDFPDALHPDDEGYTTFAVGISSLIAPTVSEMLGR